MKKKCIVFFLILAVIGFKFISTSFAESNINVKIDDRTILFDVQPQIINDRVMVPMRAIFEELGASVVWDNWTKTVTAKKGDTEVRCTIDRKTLLLNNQEIEIDVAPCIVGERTLVPARFVSQALSYDVLWDDSTKTVLISLPAKNVLNDISLWSNGSIDAKGAEYDSGTAIRTTNFVSTDVSAVYAKNNFEFYPVLYDKYGSFVGIWNGSDVVKKFNNPLVYINLEALSQYKVRIILQKNTREEISLDSCDNLYFLNKEAVAKLNNQPTLSFIDDDGVPEAINNWESICDELGISVTFAMITNKLGTNKTVPLEDIERLTQKGFEFISHTSNHNKLTTISDEAINENFYETTETLKRYGLSHRYLAYPYNATDDHVKELVSNYFDAAVSLGNTPNILPLDTYSLRRVSINDGRADENSAFIYKSIDKLKDHIDDTIINGGWTIIMTHLRNDGTFYFDDDVKNTIIELCKYANERGVKIATFGEAFEHFKNISEEGSVTSDTYRIVDCNGILHFK